MKPKEFYSGYGWLYEGEFLEKVKQDMAQYQEREPSRRDWPSVPNPVTTDLNV